ncbi:MAG: DUF262 domain-containing protein [Paraclostridium sp.]
MFKIGQKVYCTKTRFRDLIVLEINGLEITCNGESYHSGEQNYTNGWHPCKITFMVYELRNKPFIEIDSIHKPSRWNKIIQRNPNMNTSVSYLYQDVLSGVVTLNPIYQRDLVWTLKQKRSYIENLFKEKAVISPTIVLNWENHKEDAYEVLDGKQRLTTIFDFIENKFSLSNKKYFKDLSMSDANFILYHDVRYTRIEKIDNTNLTLDEKVELFLEVNELGTKMSDKHIEKVKELLGGR